MNKIFESMKTWGLDELFWIIFVLMLVATGVVCLFHKKNKSRSLLNALPGAYTSLGLLGTFIAILKSLSNIQADFNITEIIKSIVPAFSTSIAGLVFALLAIIVTKIIFGNEDNQYEQMHTDPNVLLQNGVDALQNIQINTEQVPYALGAINAKLQEQKKV